MFYNCLTVKDLEELTKDTKNINLHNVENSKKAYTKNIPDKLFQIVHRKI